MTDDEIHERLREEFRSKIPSTGELVTGATQKVLARGAEDQEWIKDNFSQLLVAIEAQAYGDYLAHEKLIAGEALRAVFASLGDGADRNAVLDGLERHAFALDRFFLGLSQGRKSRGGGAFETIITELFTRLDYPFTPKPQIDGRPDYVLPSVERYLANPLDCVVFTAKRTLRERWRQIVTEGAKGLGFFLATIDKKKSPQDLRDMTKEKIFLVVPANTKESIPAYAEAPNVLSFETFFEQRLDPAMERWRKAGILPDETS